MSENLMDLGAAEDPQNNEGDPKQVDDSSQQTDPPPSVEEPKEVERPEHIPEKFWDKDNKTIRVDDLVKSYSEVEKELHKTKNANKAPDEYEVVVPDEYKEVVELPDDDPMLVAYKGYAKENDFSQSQFDANLNFFIDFMNKQAADDQAAEIEKFGGEAKAKETIANVRTFLKNRLSPESYLVLTATTTTYEQFQALEELRKLASVQRPPPDDPSLSVEEDLSESDLRALMKKPEYYDERKRDPKLVRKVEEGFKKLYPPKKG